MFGRSGSAFRIMRVRGVNVEMDVTALLLIAFFTLPLATSIFPYKFHNRWSEGEMWLAAVLIGVLIVGAILVHELSHALVGMALGAQVERIRLFIFGGLTYFRQRPKSEGRDFLISVAGPFSNLALGGLFYLGQRITPEDSVPQVICSYLVLINLGLGIFNLLPGFPMDGGQALRAAVIVFTKRESLAALVVAISGCVVGGLLAALAAASLTRNDLFGAVWTGLIAVWIISGSLKQFWDLPDYTPRSGLARLVWGWRPSWRPPISMIPPVQDIVRARDVMSRVRAAYPPTATTAQFLSDSGLRNLTELEDAAVLEEGRLFGLVTRAMALAVPLEQRASVRLSQICAPTTSFVAIGVNDDLALVVKAMKSYPTRPVTVVEADGRFTGLISRGDLERYLRSDEPDQIEPQQAETVPPQRPSNPYL